MIISFKDKTTQAIYAEKFVKGLAHDIQQRALMKLQMLDAAGALQDLKVPPSNQLEALKGDRLGQWSIRIRSQTIIEHSIADLMIAHE